MKNTLRKAGLKEKPNFCGRCGRPRTVEAFIQHPQNAIRNLFAISLLIILISSSVSAEWLNDLGTPISDTLLAIRTGGKCSNTMSGGVICAYSPNEENPMLSLYPSLLIVDPGQAKVGSSVNIKDIVLTVMKDPAYCNNKPQFGCTSSSCLPDPLTLKFNVAKWGNSAILDSSRSITVPTASVCPAGIPCSGTLNYAISYTIPTSFDVGEYRVGAQLLDCTGKAISAEDSGSFEVVQTVTTPTCTAGKCGSWTEVDCISKTIWKQRTCQTGVLTPSNTACAVETDFDQTQKVACCLDSDCQKGQVCKSHSCSGTPIDTTATTTTLASTAVSADKCSTNGQSCYWTARVLVGGGPTAGIDMEYRYVTIANGACKLDNGKWICYRERNGFICRSDSTSCAPEGVSDLIEEYDDDRGTNDVDGNSYGATTTTLRGTTHTTLKGVTSSTLKAGVTTTTLGGGIIPPVPGDFIGTYWPYILGALIVAIIAMVALYLKWI